MKYSKGQIRESKEFLLKYLKPGMTVKTILRHFSSSGMSRNISLFIVLNDGSTLTLDHAVACVLGEPRAKDGSIRVSGCGMDMGFDIVYRLSSFLFPDGFCPDYRAIAPEGMEISGQIRDLSHFRGIHAGPLTREEISSKHEKGWRFLGGRNGDSSGWDNDGGYALKQSWI